MVVVVLGVGGASQSKPNEKVGGGAEKVSADALLGAQRILG